VPPPGPWAVVLTVVLLFVLGGRNIATAAVQSLVVEAVCPASRSWQGFGRRKGEARGVGRPTWTSSGRFQDSASWGRTVVELDDRPRLLGPSQGRRRWGRGTAARTSTTGTRARARRSARGCEPRCGWNEWNGPSLSVTGVIGTIPPAPGFVRYSSRVGAAARSGSNSAVWVSHFLAKGLTHPQSGEGHTSRLGTRRTLVAVGPTSGWASLNCRHSC
jgi:hypothetical protein